MNESAHGLARMRQTWSPPANLLGRIFAPVNNRIVGVRFMVTAFLFLLIGGLLAVLMRTQLAVPENDFLDPKLYNQLFTMHGSTMMFLFIVPFLEGLAIYFVPAMINARDMAFPRLTAFGYWIYLFGGLVFYSSFFVGQVPDTGWFAYTPLSGKEFAPGMAQDFWLIGLSLTELSGITAGAELVVTALKLRAPGMSLVRMPIFVWSMLVVGFSMLFAFTTLFVATLLLELERTFGMYFFDPAAGGSPLLWQHLFWIFGHPEVYIMFIPATGIVSTLVPTFARRPLALHRLVILALLVTGFVSFGLWVHHMFTTGLPELAASFFTATSFMIALATGTQIFAWIATLWGSRPRMTVPMLYVVGFVVIFMLGGVTGVMIASVPFDWQAHDSFFIVAHFHYVLIGGVVLPILGAIHYWFPKVTGKMMNERFGALIFWLIFVAFNVTFFPMHILGLLGMPRRVYSYQEGTGMFGYNLIATIGSYALALGFILFTVNILWSLRRGVPAGSNPWRAGTLEWQGSSPPPQYSFATPTVVHDSYPLWGDSWSDVPRGTEAARREADEEQLRMAARALDHAPQEWRANLVTSAFGGQPRGVLYYPGPTFTPFITALGVTLAAVAMLTKLVWLGIAGAVLTLVALIVWLWPDAGERELVRRSDLLLDPEGERRWPGGSEVGSLGATLFSTVVATIGAVLLFSYLYLAGFAGLEETGRLMPALGVALLLGASLLLGLSGRAFARGRSSSSTRSSTRGSTSSGERSSTRGIGGALAAAILLGLAYLGLHAYSLIQLEITPQTDARSSAFFALNGFVLVAVATGLALLAANLVRALRGLLDGMAPTPLTNAMLYWHTVVVVAALSFVVLYLVPSF